MAACIKRYNINAKRRQSSSTKRPLRLRHLNPILISVRINGNLRINKIEPSLRNHGFGPNSNIKRRIERNGVQIRSFK